MIVEAIKMSRKILSDTRIIEQTPRVLVKIKHNADSHTEETPERTCRNESLQQAFKIKDVSKKLVLFLKLSEYGA